MICNNCRREITDETLIKCPYCGSVNLINVDNTSDVNIKKEKDITVPIIIVLLLAVCGLIVFMIMSANNKNFYFNENQLESNEAVNEVIDVDQDKEYVAVSKTGQDGTATGVGVTRVVFDNQYLKQTILTSKDEVDFFIKLDNENNKSRCSEEIKQIEQRIETNYGIIAANLCEIDLSFAQEIENVIEFINK